MDKHSSILQSFSLQDKLNPEVWNLAKEGSEIMRPEIRERLLEIAYEFIEFLEIPVFIDDIILTGSLSNYNWSKFSDFDLHLIIDFNQFPKEAIELYQKLFNLKKMLFNNNHDITIKQYEVELYAQDEKEPHESTGVYSVLYDEWIKKPKKENVTINKKEIENKTKEWMNAIDEVIENADDEELEDAKELIKKYKDKIKKFRQSGLEKGGEFSNENLVFKFLRRNGYIEKLYDFENKLMDKKLSLQEKNLNSVK
jgi:hypothetical protein